MRTLRVRALYLVASVAVGGACFQVGGCGLGGALSYLAGYNPCGSVLDCDPLEYRFLTSGYRGPGADPDVTPFCTFPPFCSANVDPLGAVGFGGTQP